MNQQLSVPVVGRCGRIMLLLAAALALAPLGMALAEEEEKPPTQSVFLTGVEVGTEDDGYLYLGVIRPFDGSNLGEGWFQRFWVDYLEYKYDKNPGTVSAEAPGGEYAVGYKWPFRNASVAASVGLTYRDTRFSPSDPGNDASGGVWAVKGQLDGERRLTDWAKVDGIVSYTPALESYWLRGRVLGRVGDDLWLGPELIAMGDPAYSARQGGLVLSGVRLDAATTLEFHAGAKHLRSGDTGGYFGVSLARTF